MAGPIGNQIWYMSANSSVNEYRLNTISSSRSHEGIVGVLRGTYQKAGIWEWTQVDKHWPCETHGGAF